MKKRGDFYGLKSGGHKPAYFLTTLALFWIPVLILTYFFWNKFTRRNKRAFWLTSILLTILTFTMEIIYRRAKIWDFSEKFDSLLGIRLWGQPIEEFLYWSGATPFMLLIYLAAHWFKTEEVRAHAN